MTRDPENAGRRREDGTIPVNPRALKNWIGLAIGAIALMTLIWNALAGQVVTPPALKVVTDSVKVLADNQETMTQAQIRQNARLTDVELKLTQVQVVLEIVAIQACRDLRSDPYAYRKANCAEYLEAK